jgi:hypothetical protein
MLAQPRRAAQTGDMTGLMIRDVPDEVRDALAQEARARGQSLQKYLLGLLTAEARRRNNVVLLAQFEGRDDGTRDEGEEYLAALDRVRAERDGTLGAQ